MLHAPFLDRVPTGRPFLTVEAPPSKRLKLPGGDRSKGSGVFVHWRALIIVRLQTRPRALYARSLSAIRHLAAVLQVLGEADRGHPTAAELTLDRVAARKGPPHAL